MELVHTALGALIAAVTVAFTTLVAAKVATGLWIAVAFVGRGIYWITIGWWVHRIRIALRDF